VQILQDIAPYVALASAVLSVVLLVLVLVLWRNLRRLRHSQLVIMGSSEQRDIIAHVENLDSQVRNQREAVEILTDELDRHKLQLDRTLTNRAILRYDAFRDSGGEQSASFALLDQYRSGVVFSSIAARDFARIYVKHLRNGVADRELSPEEDEVVRQAVPRPLEAGERGPQAVRAPRPRQRPTEPAPASRDGLANDVVMEPTGATPRPAGQPADQAPSAAAGGRDPVDVFDELWPPDEGERPSS
jgi:hypothetical protein